MQTIEAVLLTGGAGRRMGAEKAGLIVDGVPLGQRIAAELSEVCLTVTVLGREPIAGHDFLRDLEEFEGPLAALAPFVPQAELVFLASCDLPLFRSSVVRDLAIQLGDADAAIPIRDGRLQPLCALYTAACLVAIPKLVEGVERRLMTWVASLNFREVSEESLSDPEAIRSANTPDELSALVSQLRSGP